MCVALIGGMDRLERCYRREAEKRGIKLKVFNKLKTGMTSRIENVDVIVIFTGKISHRARDAAVNIAKTRKTPFLMSHSCGVSALRRCFESIV